MCLFSVKLISAYATANRRISNNRKNPEETKHKNSYNSFIFITVNTLLKLKRQSTWIITAGKRILMITLAQMIAHYIEIAVIATAKR